MVATTAVLLLMATAACGGGSDSTQSDSGNRDADGDGSELVLGDDIPDYFPSDFYLPDGMRVRGVSRSGDMISLTGIFESGDIETIQADLVAGLQGAGYELLSDGDTAVFAKNGVGRVRVRTSEFTGQLTVSVDIDSWTDEQLDELRALTAEETTTAGRATAEVDGETFEAEGECFLQGPKRAFVASDGSISIQIDENQSPTYTYADITAADGRIFTTDSGAALGYGSSDQELSVDGEMVEYNKEDSGRIPFSITATCSG